MIKTIYTLNISLSIIMTNGMCGGDNYAHYIVMPFLVFWIADTFGTFEIYFIGMGQNCIVGQFKK